MKRPTQAAPPDAAPSGPPPPPSRVVPLALLALTLALFAVLKVYALNITIGDEHLYFHMAVLINKGLLPYRDFYFTHPPLHLYPAALLFRVWGYHLYLGQLLPNLSMLAGGLCVFAIGRRALSPLEGVIACALFLLSFDALRISTHFTGGNLSFALAMAGLWLGYRDRPLPAGIMFGLAALVAVYALPGAAAVALLLWGRSRGRMLRFAGTTAAVVAGGNLAFYALAGWDYVFQVYLSQFEKGPEGSLVGYRLYHRLGFILFENRLLTAGSLAGLALLLWDVRSRLRAKRSHWTVAELAARWPSGIERAETLLMLVAWFASFWAFYLLLKKHHSYYFIFIMPVFAWCSALAYVEWRRYTTRIG